MTKKVLGLGTTPNDRTGDSLRVASGKINDNFDELYAALGNGSALSVATVAKTGNYNDLLGKPSFNGFNIVSVPSSLSAPGSPRDAAIGAIDNINYLFICTSTNTWKKIPLRDDPLVLVNPPQNTYGTIGDRKGLLAVDESSLYYCIGDYVDNSTEIWKSIPWGGNSNDQNIFDENGVLQLPDGGTIAESVVTENPTIELTPANPEVESQKLIIKGGGPVFTNTENDITVGTFALTVAQGDVAFFFVNAPLYAGETFYWWVDMYSPGQEFQPDNGQLILDEFGNASFDLTVLNSNVPLRVYVADTLYNAYINSKGASSVFVNEYSEEQPDLHHLHLTTGNLQETSVFLGTDQHNVRTKIDGSVELTSYDYENESSYKLNFKENVLKISSSANEGDEDLYIKAQDDLYLDALNDDIHIRAEDDIRLRSGYNFTDDFYSYELRFTNNGNLIFYNAQDEYDYGTIRMYNDGLEGTRTIALEGDEAVAITSGYDGRTWTFDTTGNLSFPNQSGKINSSVSDGIGLQLEANLDFEIKVNPYEGADAIWSFAGTDITFPDNTVQRTAWAGGRITSTPLSSIGSSEDRAGDISFDDNYMYYCTNDYGGSITTLEWSNVSNYPGYVQATIPYAQSLANGIIQITNNAVNGVTGVTVQVDSYELVSGNTYKLYISEPGWQASYQNSELQVLSGSDIWRRVAWSNDTW